MRVRKRPLETEAFEFQHVYELPAGICLNGSCGRPKPHLPHIHGSRGIIEVKKGDWIVTGINGCKYPIDPETFDKIYEIIE